VRAAGVEPAQLFRAEGFSYHFGFRRLTLARSRGWLVRGLDYTFTVALARVRCCSSSLYTFAPAVRPERLARDCLLPVSPTLGSSAPRISPRALNVLSPLRLPVSPRPLSYSIPRGSIYSGSLAVGQELLFHQAIAGSAPEAGYGEELCTRSDYACLSPLRLPISPRPTCG